MKRNKKGQFIRGTNGNVYHGFGVWYDKKGYPTIFINGKDIKLHVYIWEQANGEKPEGIQLHHKDLDKSNYKLENLELVNQSDHFRIHAGWKRKNGKWILKPCMDCKKLLPLKDFYQRKGLTPLNKCIKCRLIYDKKLAQNPDVKKRRKKYMTKYYQNNKHKWKKYAGS